MRVNTQLSLTYKPQTLLAKKSHFGKNKTPYSPKRAVYNNVKEIKRTLHHAFFEFIKENIEPIKDFC